MGSDTIGETVGDWGKWQLRSVLLIFLCKIPSCWFMAIIIFTAPSPKQSVFECYNGNPANGSAIDWGLALHPELIERNDKQFDIAVCDVDSDFRDHARFRMAFNQTDHMPESAVPCESLDHKPYYHLKETFFDIFCSRNFVAATTQIAHLFGVLTGGIFALKFLNV